MILDVCWYENEFTNPSLSPAVLWFDSNVVPILFPAASGGALRAQATTPDSKPATSVFVVVYRKGIHQIGPKIGSIFVSIIRSFRNFMDFQKFYGSVLPMNNWLRKRIIYHATKIHFFYNFDGFCHGFDINYWMMI